MFREGMPPVSLKALWVLANNAPQGSQHIPHIRHQEAGHRHDPQPPNRIRFPRSQPQSQMPQAPEDHWHLRADYKDPHAARHLDD
jgi:hypothetical protein